MCGWAVNLVSLSASKGIFAPVKQAYGLGKAVHGADDQIGAQEKEQHPEPRCMVEIVQSKQVDEGRHGRTEMLVQFGGSDALGQKGPDDRCGGKSEENKQRQFQGGEPAQYYGRSAVFFRHEKFTFDQDPKKANYDNS